MDTWQFIIYILLIGIVLSYLSLMFIDKVGVFDSPEFPKISNKEKEGFEGSVKEDSDASKSKYEWLSNEDLFDDFYASVFTKLTINDKLVQAEAAICLEEFSKTTPKDQLSILDAGCGVGIATVAFAKQGVNTVVGVDRSPAMIRYAKNSIVPSTTLTETQRQSIEFRLADLNGPGSLSAAEFTSACVLYFTIYYFRNMETLFRNLALWVKPGGTLAVEVVNKYKFEPVLDSANPWVGFSPQKYMKDRNAKSKVVFDKFDYEAVFDLDDPRAEFRETFRFKDGTTRRQKHTLFMPSIQEIVQKANNSGWTYTKYVDLTVLSFPYGYILFFRRNPE